MEKELANYRQITRNRKSKKESNEKGKDKR